MKTKTKKILVPFILMIIFNLTVYSIFDLNYGGGMNPHIGIIFISGLLFGPYGALGVTIGNLICDLFRGYPLAISVASEIISFGVSLFAYKLWYENFRTRIAVTKPKLNNTTHLVLFITIILVCALIYSILHQKIILMYYPGNEALSYNVGFRYWLNFINSSFLMGIIGIWLSSKIDFVHVPKKSDKRLNRNLYAVIGSLLIISLIFVTVTDYLYVLSQNVIIAEAIIISVLLFAYLTKPIVHDIAEIKWRSTSESIMNIFLTVTIILLIFGYIIAGDSDLMYSVLNNFPMETNDIASDIFIFVDCLLALFLIPSLGVLKFIEKKVIWPIVKFSQIEGIIKEGYKIESESLIKIYGEYANEENEIGLLARSYTELINYNNNYITNIKEIEGERERIRTELDIAENIQRANLPTEIIENEDYLIYGFSKPARHVGGDFFDYYTLDDENLVIVIGDATGKGIPAALLSVITQNLIKQLTKTTRDPSKILESLNEQLCENNPDAMFITLWIGIYNRDSNKIICSNAGHNHPFIRRNGVLDKLEIDNGIALGVLDDFEYENMETDIGEGLVLYTDGITDVYDENKNPYGEDRLAEFLNETDFDKNMINNLLDNINEFSSDEGQFDDMTMLVLIKK